MLRMSLRWLRTFKPLSIIWVKLFSTMFPRGFLISILFEDSLVICRVIILLRIVGLEALERKVFCLSEINSLMFSSVYSC